MKITIDINKESRQKIKQILFLKKQDIHGLIRSAIELYWAEIFNEEIDPELDKLIKQIKEDMDNEEQEYLPND